MLYAPLVVWIGVILFLGSSQGASTRTSLIIRPILEFLFPSASDETLQLYHGVIRKSAHFTEYAILALLSVRAFTKTSIHAAKRFPFLIALAVTTVVAGLDELNQSLDSTRTGAIADVALDVFGGAFMLGLLSLLNVRRSKLLKPQH